MGAIDRYLAHLASALGDRATRRALVEIADHLQDAAQHYRARGMTVGDAEVWAVADFGPVDHVSSEFLNALDPGDAEIIAFTRRETVLGEMVEVEVSGFTERLLTGEGVAESSAKKLVIEGSAATDVNAEAHRVVHGIILKEKDGERDLCIYCGPFEAASIAWGKEHVPTDRPMTHDLFGALIGSLDDVSLSRVVITKLEGDTFHAEMEMTHHDERLVVDCRPSDGIAVAVRLGIPIFVSREVPPFSRVA